MLGSVQQAFAMFRARINRQHDCLLPVVKGNQMCMKQTSKKYMMGAVYLLSFVEYRWRIVLS